MLNDLYWRESLWLGAMLLPGVVFLLARFRQHQVLQRIVDSHLMPWVTASSHQGQQASVRWFFIVAWLLLCISLAGPRTPRLVPPELQPPGVAVVVVFDYSASMFAGDGKPDRLRQAQQLFQHWLDTAAAPIQLGLVVFSGHAHLLIKPSDDHQLLRHFSEQLAAIKLPTLGNNLAEALHISADNLQHMQGQKNIVILTDGDLDAIAKQAAEAVVLSLPRDIAIQVVGIGGSEAVRVPASATEALMSDGEQVISRRDAQWLKQLAASVAGAYLPIASAEQKTLAELLNLQEPRFNAEERQQILWNEWFALPLLPGVLLILLGLSRARKQAMVANVIPVLLLLAYLPGFVANAEASSSTAEYGVLFNEATVCYRRQDYPCALQAFSRAAWLTTDDQLRGRAVFNLANTHFYLGDYEQASVLFAQAGRLGVAAEITRYNQTFADSLAMSVRKRLADIAETERRADWRAAARDLPDELGDRLAEGRYLSRPEDVSQVLHGLSAVQLNALIDRGIGRLQGAGGAGASGYSTQQWVKSPQQNSPGDTADLFNQLLPKEIGLPVTPDEAYRLQGQRPW